MEHEQNSNSTESHKHDHECCKDKKKNMGGLFIPAGVFLGMGLGFLYNNLVAGLFIGLGVGFAIFGLSVFTKK